MIYRAFRRTDTDEWLDVLFTINAASYDVDPDGQAADLAAALGIAPSVLEAVDDSKDPRSGDLCVIPARAEEEEAATFAANRETLKGRAATALTANAAFLALQSPTNAQTLAQVKMLTKECSALVRLALDLLDSTDGT